MTKNKALLIIMDGWGHGKKDASNAIHLAKTPYVDGLYEQVPNAELRTDGEHVGLPEGQMGNSEVGHLNIGAGRIVHQDLAKINNAIRNKSFFSNEKLMEAITLAKEKEVAFHIMGLVSDGGIHSSIEHLNAILDACEKSNLKNVFVHAFTDGRDTDQHNGVVYIEELNKKLKQSKGKLASIVGRYYAMDRDHRWARIKKAYDLITAGIGDKSKDPLASIRSQYDKGVSDEFLEPICIVDNQGEAIGKIKDDDVVVCFNFRTDRCRQITTALTQENLDEFDMKALTLNYFTMTRYDESFKKVSVFYEKDNLINTLGEVVSAAGRTQVRMAETEKYPHVTFFFSGGREEEFNGEKRVMANSPQVATYDLKPEMSAYELVNSAESFLEKENPDLAIINFANPDMVGHTGIRDAIIKAVETTDQVTKQLVLKAQALNYEIIIIADHGNAELNINPDGSAHTSHTTNPVPVFYIGEKFKQLNNGILADVAPTLLSMMEIEQPIEMTGQSILE